MPSISTTMVPDCYPLSRSMVELLADERQIPSNLTIPYEMIEGPAPVDRIEELKHSFLLQWKPLVDEIAQLRAQAEEPLKPVLEGYQSLSTKEFVEILYKKTPLKQGRSKVSPMTVSRWRGRGFIRPVDNNEDLISAETALAVLIMRMADRHHQKGWLPPGPHQNEPYMYVWRKDAPNTPAIPCGLPLGDDVPNHAFLFTPFRFLGLLYPDYWFPFANLGSVRFAGTTLAGQEKRGNRVLWNLSEEEILIWDPSIKPLGRGILDTLALQARDSLANLVLLRLATQEFHRAILPA